ncbi:MAG: PspC domain-containing protein [Candidatus Neomarinimicrobiota bacterium]
MKKTVTINLAGVVIRIDEDAFEQLQEYLNSIKLHFSSGDGRDEIMADIESRIAELFQEMKLEIIGTKNVAKIISVMGSPEEYLDDSGEEEKKETITEKIKKRIFRNPDDNIIGGVCGGLGSYFDVDPVWFRLGFVIGTLIGGSGILIYLILWFIVPEARSTADKLQMQGEPITAENIKKTVLVEKVREVKSSINNINTNKIFSVIRNAVQLVLQLLQKIFKLVFKLIKPVFGVIFLVSGVSLTLMLVFLFFGVNWAGGLFNFGHASELSYMFDSLISFNPVGHWLAVTGLLLLVGIPLFQIMYFSLRLLFGLEPQRKSLKATFTGLWIASLMMVIIFSMFSFFQFSASGYAEEKIILKEIKRDTLFLSLVEDPVYSIHDRGRNFIFNEAENMMQSSEVDLDILTSNDDKFYLEIKKTAMGNNRKKARNLASEILYEYETGADRIRFNNNLSIPHGSPFKFQEVELTLFVPRGKAVFLDNSLKYLIYNIHNTSNTYDRAMVNHTWLMTKKGLECTDCD